jgi:hypothetical protein
MEGSSMKYANGIWSAIVRLWKRLFGRDLKAATEKPKAITPIDSLGGKGHYFDGNAANGYQFRSSQSKRRKMERRVRG